jgi:rod shape-determining protein MreC
MTQIIVFFIQNRVNILFLLLIFLSLYLIVTRNQQQGAIYRTSSNAVTGKVLKTVGALGDYVALEEKNRLLMQENARLHTELQSLKYATIPNLDSSLLGAFEFVAAKVVSHTFTNSQNFLTIDKGAAYGIKTGMGVVSPLGVVGKVKSVSKNFAVVISLLNTNYQVAAKLKRGTHRCVVNWDSRDYSRAKLLQVGRHVKVVIGDTVVTVSENTVFPEGTLIGTVDYVKKDPSKIFYDIEIKLSVDFTAPENVYVVKGKFISQIDSLQKTTR